MIKPKNCSLIFFIACLFPSLFIFDNQTAFAYERVDTCDEIKDVKPYVVDEYNSLYTEYKLNESKNGDITIYLKTPSGCRVVLSTEGSGVRFVKNETNKFPDVQALWHISASESKITYYIWSGEKYISRDMAESERLNKEALVYFKKGNLDRAIKIWKKAKDLSVIPGLGFTSNAEVLNNLGFAYYTLAKQSRSAEHYKRAEYYLDATIQVDYNRWEAHLNLGDLYMEVDNPRQALQSYEKLLKLNPKYKYADKIRDKIRILQGQIKNTDE